MLHIVLKTVGIQWKKGKICGILNKKDKILGAAKAQPKEEKNMKPEKINFFVAGIAAGLTVGLLLRHAVIGTIIGTAVGTALELKKPEDQC